MSILLNEIRNEFIEVYIDGITMFLPTNSVTWTHSFQRKMKTVPVAPSLREDSRDKFDRGHLIRAVAHQYAQKQKSVASLRIIRS